MSRARAQTQTARSRVERTNVPVKSKLEQPPRANPRAFEFLENFCSNPPSRVKELFKCPTPGKITRLLFYLFSSFYYASEAVHVNIVYQTTHIYIVDINRS